jgi:hypothetical protein
MTANNMIPMMTYMRDPLTRYISSFTYPGHHGGGCDKNITCHTIFWPEYSNTQTNFLSRAGIGTWDKGKYANKAREKPPDASTLPDESEMQRRLQEATALLEKLAFLGLVEHWNDSLRLFCRKYTCNDLETSLKAPPARQQTEHAKPKDYIAADLEVVRESHSYDIQLYKSAIRRFCRDLYQYKSDKEFMASLQPDTVELCAAQQE